jgi:hypothetical protein
MKMFVVFLLVLGIVETLSMSCVQLEYIYQQSDCCQLQNDVPCLSSIPKLDFQDMVARVDKQLSETKSILDTTPKLLNKTLGDFCHNTEPIIGGVHMDQYTGFKWHNRPELYCNGNEDRLVLIPQYFISNCYFEFTAGDLKWTAKIPFNPAMTIASYHQGTQSITKAGFCLQSGNVTDAMTISQINSLVASKGGIIYQTTAVDSHALKFPCTDATQKILGDASKRVTAMPLCSVPYNPSTGVALNNKVDCEAAGGSFDHALYVQMKSAWYTVDLYKEYLLQKLYFTRYTGSTFLRYCLRSEYDNPINYVDGRDYSFDSDYGGHTVEIDN